MKKTILLIFLCFWFANCEDTKKTNETLEEISSEKPTETQQIETKQAIQKETTDGLKPIVSLTNDSLDDFLLNYGAENQEHRIQLETTEGIIQLELYKDTPLHRAHFIYLIKNGYLNTTVFHRVVKDFMIQGGNSDRMETARLRRKMGKYTLPAEIKYKHHRGALAAAKEYRENPDDRSSSFEFYIVQSPKGAYHLDKNYTVFGKVISGMEVVDKIAKLATDEGEWPLHNVFINAVIEE